MYPTKEYLLATFQAYDDIFDLLVEYCAEKKLRRPEKASTEIFRGGGIEYFWEERDRLGNDYEYSTKRQVVEFKDFYDWTINNNKEI